MLGDDLKDKRVGGWMDGRMRGWTLGEYVDELRPSDCMEGAEKQTQAPKTRCVNLMVFLLGDFWMYFNNPSFLCWNLGSSLHFHPGEWRVSLRQRPLDTSWSFFFCFLSNSRRVTNSSDFPGKSQLKNWKSSVPGTSSVQRKPEQLAILPGIWLAILLGTCPSLPCH